MKYSPNDEVLVFKIDSGSYALHLDLVDRAMFAAAVTALPDSPEHILGTINIAGEAVPVFSLRKRLNLTNKQLQPSDIFILLRINSKPLMLWADKIESIGPLSKFGNIESETISPEVNELSDGIIKTNNGLIILCPDKLFEL